MPWRRVWGGMARRKSSKGKGKGMCAPGCWCWLVNTCLVVKSTASPCAIDLRGTGSTCKSMLMTSRPASTLVLVWMNFRVTGVVLLGVLVRHGADITASLGITRSRSSEGCGPAHHRGNLFSIVWGNQPTRVLGRCGVMWTYPSCLLHASCLCVFRLVILESALVATVGL